MQIIVNGFITPQYPPHVVNGEYDDEYISKVCAWVEVDFGGDISYQLSRLLKNIRQEGETDEIKMYNSKLVVLITYHKTVELTVANVIVPSFIDVTSVIPGTEGDSYVENMKLHIPQEDAQVVKKPIASFLESQVIEFTQPFATVKTDTLLNALKICATDMSYRGPIAYRYNDESNLDVPIERASVKMIYFGKSGISFMHIEDEDLYETQSEMAISMIKHKYYDAIMEEYDKLIALLKSNYNDAWRDTIHERTKIEEYRAAVRDQKVDYDTIDDEIEHTTYYIDDLYNTMRDLLAQRDEILARMAEIIETNPNAAISEEYIKLENKLTNLYEAILEIREALFTSANVDESRRPAMTDIASYDMSDVLELVFGLEPNSETLETRFGMDPNIRDDMIIR